jgi:hypothetical protein
MKLFTLSEDDSAFAFSHSLEVGGDGGDGGNNLTKPTHRAHLQAAE